MADWLRQSIRAHHALEKSASGNGQTEPLTEQAGGVMAIEGTEADAEHSCGELSEQGKQVWRTGSGMDGGGKE
jgi:hypothetical protein